MLNLLQINVITEDDLEDLIFDGYLKQGQNIEEITEIDMRYIHLTYTYAQTALVNLDTNTILYWDDNVRGNPEKYLAAFFMGIVCSETKFTLKKMMMLENDVKEKFKGVRFLKY